MDLNDPKSIELWELSENNVCDAKVFVVNLSCFPSRNLSEVQESEAVAFPLYANDGLSNGSSKEQRDAILEFVENENVYFKSLRTAVYEYYLEGYNDWMFGISLGQELFGGTDDLVKEMLPKISDGTEIDEKVALGKITIGRDGHIGFTFSVDWSDKGMGVEMDRGKVVNIGNWFVGNL